MGKLLALDVGAESGRGVLGLFDGRKLKLEEVHRFPNLPVRVHESLFWNVLGLFDEMKKAVAKATRRHGADIAGLGIDTWGVDMALIGPGDVILGNVHHYRDTRTTGVMDKVFEKVPREEVFRLTGVQFMEINTLYQLYSLALQGSPLLEAAEKLLMIGDLFNFLFTGVKSSEFSLATTSQMYDTRRRDWSRELLRRLELPEGILPEVVSPGTVLGPVVRSVAEETGAEGLKVIAPAVHDTGSAVAAVPAENEGWCYISSGTWCLMGIETGEPIITDGALANNFTNEGGVEGTYRFLRNIVGLWLIQECRREWEKEGDAVSYAELTDLASSAAPRTRFINPEHTPFYSPGRMPEKVREFCLSTDQSAPEDRGEMVRCILESLALKYRDVLERIEGMTSRKIDRVHIVGGGSQNVLLNQLAADATGRMVLAGPVEATAIGNILTQAVAAGELGSLAEIREVVRRSFPLKTYEPHETDAWDEAYERFERLCAGEEARY